MIKFRQKIFFWGAALNVAGTGLMLNQGSSQSKQAEEQAERQEELIRAQNKKLDKLAEVNPQVANEAASILQDRSYAMINPNLLKNIKGLGKDIKTVAWDNETRRNNILGGLMVGGAMGLSAVGVDKLIQQDAKKNGIDFTKVNNNNQQFQQKYYSAGSILRGVWKNNKGNLLTMTALSTAPVATQYCSEKKALKDQMDYVSADQPQQRSYAFSPGSVIKGLKSGLKGAGNFFKNPGTTIKNAWTREGGGFSSSHLGKQSLQQNWQQLTKHPIDSTTSFISKNLAWIGGKGGVQSFGKDLSQKGTSEWSRKAGDWIQKNPNLATAASIPVGIGVVGATWGGGEKAVKKVARTIDPNATAYQDFKEQQVQ